MTKTNPTLIVLLLAFVFIAIVIFGSAKLVPTESATATNQIDTPQMPADAPTHRETSSVPASPIIDN